MYRTLRVAIMGKSPFHSEFLNSWANPYSIPSCSVVHCTGMRLGLRSCHAS